MKKSLLLISLSSIIVVVSFVIYHSSTSKAQMPTPSVSTTENQVTTPVITPTVPTATPPTPTVDPKKVAALKTCNDAADGQYQADAKAECVKAGFTAEDFDNAGCTVTDAVAASLSKSLATAKALCAKENN